MHIALGKNSEFGAGWFICSGSIRLSMSRLLKCGHLSSSDQNPICSICPVPNWDGIEPDYTLPQCQFDDTPYPPKLVRCCVCGKVSSSVGSMFERQPDQPYDLHYDGCRQRDMMLLQELIQNRLVSTGKTSPDQDLQCPV